MTIDGLVARPGTYPFADNTTLEDLILQAGGLLEGASTARVEIARRIVDPTSTVQTQRLADLYTVSIACSAYAYIATAMKDCHSECLWD